MWFKEALDNYTDTHIHTEQDREAEKQIEETFSVYANNFSIK